MMEITLCYLGAHLEKGLGWKGTAQSGEEWVAAFDSGMDPKIVLLDRLKMLR